MGKCMGRCVFGGKDGSWMWLDAYVGGGMGGWHTLRICRGTAGSITAHSGVCVWVGGWVWVCRHWEYLGTCMLTTAVLLDSQTTMT